MKRFVLYRYEYGSRNTLGVLIEKDYVCDTLELPWLDNERNISCIPEGTFTIEAYSSPHFEEAVLVKDVPNRVGILIHPANEVRELRGCIAPGIKSLDIVLHSRDNLAKILDILGTEQGFLTIKKVAYGIL